MGMNSRERSSAATPPTGRRDGPRPRAAAKTATKPFAPVRGRHLERALEACRNAARRGHEEALAHSRQVESALEQAAGKIRSKQADLARDRVETSDAERNLKVQLAKIERELDRVRTKFRASLAAKGERLDDFSIALFGRTMAGKSTFMEILTEGDGTSIGTGAQRTTRDVRTYRWRGIRVTDVPGVAAFEGKADEELAFKAADEADLVIFLITDDAPQAAEAECLARLRTLGKPVLGICNVKFAVEEGADPAALRRRAARAFRPERLNALIEQFRELAQARLPRDRTVFVWTNLRARFLAAHETDRSRREVLTNVSRFDRVEREIVSAVAGRGTFLRNRSFIDAAVVPILRMMDGLLEFSAENAACGRVLVDKRRQLLAWREDFRDSGRRRIDDGVRQIVDGLRASIPAFTEDNYDRPDAGKRWRREVKGHGLKKAAVNIQRKLWTECQGQLAHVGKEFEAEWQVLRGLKGDESISMREIIDGKRWWNLGVSVLSVVMTFMSGGLSASLTAIGGKILSFFFDDREEKATKQRKALQRKLRKDADRLEHALGQRINVWFGRELLRRVEGLVDDMSMATHSLFDLANTQRALAWKLNGTLKSLHRQLLREALDHLGAGDAVRKAIRDVARVPGTGTTLCVDPESGRSDDVQRKLGILLGESVWIVRDTGSRFSVLCQALGIHLLKVRHQVSVEEKIQMAHVPVGLLTPVRRARIRLAQQLTELHVTKKRTSNRGEKR